MTQTAWLLIYQFCIAATPWHAIPLPTMAMCQTIRDVLVLDTWVDDIPHVIVCATTQELLQPAEPCWTGT